MKKILYYLKKNGPYLNNFFGGGLPFYPFGIALVFGGLIGAVIGIVLVMINYIFKFF
ncbi:MAG: hypothetical protein H7196_03490 [candidate division SR1 bacterium]|nr:hypothetical protein [candidate division SR1 bacterium]